MKSYNDQLGHFLAVIGTAQTALMQSAKVTEQQTVSSTTT